MPADEHRLAAAEERVRERPPMSGVRYTSPVYERVDLERVGAVVVEVPFVM
jgi:hypothetical protein